MAPHRQRSVVCCWSDPSPRHHLQASSQVGCGLRLRAPVSYQLGRSVLVSLARPAETYALVTHVRRSAVTRECPSIIVASGPGVARTRTRGLFVPKPSCGTAYQRRSMCGLRQTVRGCPLKSAVGRGDCHSLCHSVCSRASMSGCCHPRFQVCTPGSAVVGRVRDPRLPVLCVVR